MMASIATWRCLARGLLVALALVVACGLVAHADAAASSTVPSSAAGGTCQPPARAPGQAATVHRATLVVTFGGGLPTKSFCIEFTEDSISGLELLQSADPQVVVSSASLGSAVCAIDGVGSTDPATYSTCFAESPDYWAYYQWVSGAWQMSPLGASSTVVRDGSMEGWAWGNNAKPDSPLGVCPTPTPTAAATLTPLPSPTPAAAIPTRTPRPSATAPDATSTPAAPSSADAAAAPTAAAPGAGQGDPGASDVTATSDVRGEQRAPAASPGASVTAAPDTPGALPSPSVETGVIVSPSEGRANVAHSQEVHATGGGRTRLGLIAFGFVAAALLVLATIRVLRRRHGG